MTGEQAVLCESFWPSSSGEMKHCVIDISVILPRMCNHRFLFEGMKVIFAVMTPLNLQ